VCKRNLPRDRSHPISAISSDKSNVAPLDPQVVDSSHPYRVSRFRMFRQSVKHSLHQGRRQWRRDINAVAKKETHAQGETWVLFSVLLDNLIANGWKTKSYRLGPPSRGKQCMGRSRTTPYSNQPGRCATRIDLWRLGSALRRTRVG